MVEVHVDHCFAELQKLKEGKLGRSTYLDKLKSDITKDSQGKMMFKGNHPLKGNNNIDSIKVTFIDKIVENLNTRFPKEESIIVYAFGVLGLRPISLLPPSDLEEWGNSKLETLINHFGKERSTSKFKTCFSREKLKLNWKLRLALEHSCDPMFASCNWLQSGFTFSFNKQ